MSADESHRPTLVQEAPAGSGLADLFGILRRRKWVCVVTVALALSAAAAIVAVQIPLYTAEGSIFVSAKQAQIVDLQPVLATASPNPFLLQSQLDGEIEIITSYPLAARVVDALDLVHDAELVPPADGARGPTWSPTSLAARTREVALLGLRRLGLQPAAAAPPPADPAALRTAAIANFRTRLKVAPVGRATVLTVAFSSTDPAKAARFVNGVMQQYVDGTVRAKAEATRDAARWLETRLEQLRATQTELDSAIAQYMVSHGLSESGDDAAMSQQIAQVKLDVMRAWIDQHLAQEKLARSGPESDQDVLSSPLIAQLRAQQSEFEKEVRQALTQYGEKHPAVVTARAALARIQARIDAEIEKVRTAERAAVAIATAKVNGLKAQLDELSKMPGQRGVAEVKLREMKREANANSALYEQFLKRYQEVSQQVDVQQPDAEIISPAQVPTVPSYPKKGVFLTASFVLALITAGCIAFVLEIFSERFRTIDQMERTLGRPTLAVIPRVPATVGRRLRPDLYLLMRPESPFGEALRTLGTSIRLLSADRPRCLLFASALPQEGKTSTALSFARLAARLGERVVLVDCDLRHADADKRGAARPGLSDLLLDPGTLQDAMQADPETGLRFIGAGTVTNLPADLLVRGRIRGFLEELRRNYDLVILDGPAVLSVGDSRVLARLADHTVFVVQWGRTSCQDACKGLNLMLQAGANVLGIVVSRADPRLIARYNYQRRGKRNASLLLGA